MANDAIEKRDELIRWMLEIILCVPGDEIWSYRRGCIEAAYELGLYAQPVKPSVHLKLFGTPERAAATVAAMPCGARPCSECPVFEPCDGFKFDGGVALAEWLRGDAE